VAISNYSEFRSWGEIASLSLAMTVTEFQIGWVFLTPPSVSRCEESGVTTTPDNGKLSDNHNLL
jgi:hypothetical protein